MNLLPQASLFILSSLITMPVFGSGSGEEIDQNSGKAPMYRPPDERVIARLKVAIADEEPAATAESVPQYNYFNLRESKEEFLRATLGDITQAAKQDARKEFESKLLAAQQEGSEVALEELYCCYAGKKPYALGMRDEKKAKSLGKLAIEKDCSWVFWFMAEEQEDPTLQEQYRMEAARRGYRDALAYYQRIGSENSQYNDEIARRFVKELFPPKKGRRKLIQYRESS